MTIRFKCDQCDSVLKIKDELAGTSAKCPKCKKKFVVPQPESGSAEESAEVATAGVETRAAGRQPDGKPAARAQAKPVKAAPDAPGQAAAPAGEEEFDPLAFLMDESAPGAKSSAGLSSQPAEPEARPVTDRQGRRHIVAPPPTPRDADASPAAMSAGAALSASANARDLLTKTMEDSRAKASSLPEAKSRLPSLDWAALRYQLRQMIVPLTLAVVAVGAVYWLTTTVMSTKLPLPKLGQVSGTVTLDGKPLPDMIVVLTPVTPQGLSDKGKPLRLRDAMGMTDQNGRYTAEYLVGVPGAPVGNVRIWLKARLDQPQNVSKIPREYQNPGGDTREVKATGNDGKFNLELKSGR